MKPCPKCGKVMQEEPKAPGVWLCPDYKSPLNDTKPIKYKCDGMEITEKGVQAFNETLREVAFEKYLEKIRWN